MLDLSLLSHAEVPTRPTLAQLASFATMIAEAAHLPLVPVSDWASRAAKAINGGGDIAATCISLVDIESGAPIHVGAACGPRVDAFKNSLLILAASHPSHFKRAPQPTLPSPLEERTRVVEWAEHSLHPFLEAGLSRGDVLRTAKVISSRVLMIVSHWSGPTERTQHNLDAMDTVVALVASIASELGSAPDAPIEWLSVKESEVLEFIVNGATVREIAEALERSPHTIHDHLKAVHRKTGRSSRGALVAAASGRRTLVAACRNLPVEPARAHTTGEATVLTPCTLHAQQH